MTRVLVVEDEESFSDPVAYMLRREGYEVSVAATGPDGLAEFERAGADLVLLDVMLPGLSGTEVCRSIRTRSNVPIIMLTARDSEIDKVVGLSVGADDYVTKPFSPRELTARIQAMRRRPRGSTTEPEVREFGDVRIDPVVREVTVAGRPAELTKIEFDLLDLLSSSPRTVTRCCGVPGSGSILARSRLTWTSSVLVSPT